MYKHKKKHIPFELYGVTIYKWKTIKNNEENLNPPRKGLYIWP